MLSYSQVILLYLLSKALSTSGQECPSGFCTHFVPTKHSGTRLVGHVISTFHPSPGMSCLDYCAMNCKCVSVNVKKIGGDCELNWMDLDTSSESVIKNIEYDYYDVQMNIRMVNNKCPISPCDNSCCLGNPCGRHGTCREECNHAKYKFYCSCAQGFGGRFCEDKLAVSTSEYTSSSLPSETTVATTLSTESDRSSQSVDVTQTSASPKETSQTLLLSTETDTSWTGTASTTLLFSSSLVLNPEATSSLIVTPSLSEVLSLVVSTTVVTTSASIAPGSTDEATSISTASATVILSSTSSLHVSSISSVSTSVIKPKSCKEILRADKESTSRQYELQTDNTTTLVYCVMQDTKLGSCSDGGWTLTMKIDGSKDTFLYDSSYWINKLSYQPEHGQTLNNSFETKLPTFWTVPFTEMCVGMQVGQTPTQFVKLKVSGNSLYDIISTDIFTKTAIGRATWKDLLVNENNALQDGCSKEGFNVMTNYNSTLDAARVRIGIVADDDKDCANPNSWIGFGGGGKACDQWKNSCGNEATCLAPGSEQQAVHIKAIGYILVM